MRIQFSLLAKHKHFMLITSILTILSSNSVTLRRDISIIFNRITIYSLTYCATQDVTSLLLLSTAIGLYGGLLFINNISKVFHIFVFIISVFILQLTSFFPRKIWLVDFSSLKYLLFTKISSFFKNKILNKMAEHLSIIEYPLILLFIISGAIFLMSTSDLISTFLAIELQSYGLYILSTIYRNSEFSTTGGLIYFLLGGLSSCFILLGTSLLYSNSGTTSLDGLYVITSISDINDNVNFWYKPLYINFALLVFSVGFLFKVSAAPFHFWSPDVYDAIPTIVTTFVAIVAKISIFVFLLEIVYYTGNYFFVDGGQATQSLNWTYGLLISSLLSLIIGTIVGLTQFRIKRLLAYSTISHVGFILLALSISTIESTQAFLFYLIQYSISNLNAFIILVAIGFFLYSYSNENKEYKQLLDKNNSPIQLISQLKGFFFLNPLLALSLGITIFSFAGIPPLVGFFGKQMVLSAALDKGYFFLALVAILTSVIGAVYYLNVIKEIFFYSSEYKLNPEGIKIYHPSFYMEYLSLIGYYNKLRISKASQYMCNITKNINYRNIVLSSNLTITISIITLVVLLFIFMNKEWLSMGTILVQVMFNS